MQPVYQIFTQLENVFHLREHERVNSIRIIQKYAKIR